MKTFLLLVLVLITVDVFAAAKPLTKQQIAHLTIRSVEVKDLTDLYRLKAPSKVETSLKMAASGQTFALGTIAKQVDKAEYIVDKIINIGQKVWNVVEKGRPVQNVQGTVANALPLNANNWTDLSNWKQPESRVIGISYKNAYGIEVVRFVYRIILLSGGTVNGVGNYIGYASVEPVEVSTSYMYTFNSQAVVVNIYNKGSQANPLAGMILTVRWSIETVVKKALGSHTYYLDGAGNIDSADKTVLK